MLNLLWSLIAAWYNLPFSLVLALCVIVSALQLSGFGAEADGDADGTPEPDADLDAEAETAAEQAAEGEGENDMPLAQVLSFIGLGKAPLMIVLLVLFSTFGITGLALNAIVQAWLGSYPAFAFSMVLPAALATAGMVTARTARLIGRALPPLSTSATRAQAFVGRSGRVISPFLDGKYGQVHLRDESGTLISVFAVTRKEAAIRRGDEVVLCAYDAEQRRYVATRAAGRERDAQTESR